MVVTRPTASHRLTINISKIAPPNIEPVTITYVCSSYIFGGSRFIAAALLMLVFYMFSRATAAVTEAATASGASVAGVDIVVCYFQHSIAAI